jgi:hypothetical protein
MEADGADSSEIIILAEIVELAHTILCQNVAEYAPSRIAALPKNSYLLER